MFNILIKNIYLIFQKIYEKYILTKQYGFPPHRQSDAGDCDLRGLSLSKF